MGGPTPPGSAWRGPSAQDLAWAAARSAPSPFAPSPGPHLGEDRRARLASQLRIAPIKVGRAFKNGKPRKTADYFGESKLQKDETPNSGVVPREAQ